MAEEKTTFICRLLRSAPGPKWILLVLLLPALQAEAEFQVQAKGLFPGRSAVLLINGEQRLLKVGKRSPEGVLLVSVDKAAAVIEIDGRRRSLTLSRIVSSGYSAPKTAVARIQSGNGGHYYTPGRINGIAVKFLVDTGATSVAMNLPEAKRLGLNYRAGREITVGTASGTTKAYLVQLDSVRVGEIEVRNVEAAVHLGNFPSVILLGNSYLSRVELNRENGVLVLESRY